MKYTDQEKRSLREIWEYTDGRGMLRMTDGEKKNPISRGHWKPQDYDDDNDPDTRWYKIPPLPKRLFENHLAKNGVFAACPAFWEIAIVDVDHGCPDRTIEHIGTDPVHKCATKRGHHLFYAVPDAPSVKDWSARTGIVKDENGNLIFEGEIASVRRYAKIHHPNDFWTAVSKRGMEPHPLPLLPELLNTGYAKDKPKSKAEAGDQSEIEREVEEIATKLGLTKKGSRWEGGCPNCGEGDSGTRFQVKAGYANPLMICRSCSPEGFDKTTIAKIMGEVDADADISALTEPKPDDQKYKLLAAPYRSKYPLSQPGNLIDDICRAIGIAFRTNITRNIEEVKIDGFTLDRNDRTIWVPYLEGIERTLSIIFERNALYETKKDGWQPVNIASTNPRLKDYIYAELHSNKYHPFKEYLDALPAWDGCGRMERLLDFLGLKIDIAPEFARWAHTYLLIEPIRLNLFPGSERKTHLVLSGGTNTGKSQIGKRIFPEHLANADYQNEGFVFDGDKTDQMYQVLGYILCEGSEFTGGDIASIRQAKAFLSQPGYGGGRVRYAKRQAHGYRADTIYFSTNDRSPLPPDDPAMDGRLIIAIVNGQCEHDGEVAFPILDQLANPEHPERGTIREQLWAEAYRAVNEAIGTNTVLRNPYLPPYELATKAQAWNSYVGAHYSTEMTVRREQMQTAIDELGNPSKIEFETLIEEMYRAETGEPVVKVGDRADIAFENYKRQHPKHKVINAMSMLGYRWARGRIDRANKWIFYDGQDGRRSKRRQ